MSQKKSSLFPSRALTQLTRSEMSSLMDEGLMVIADAHMAHHDYELALDNYSRVNFAEAAFKQAQVNNHLDGDG